MSALSWAAERAFPRGRGREPLTDRDGWTRTQVLVALYLDPNNYSTAEIAHRAGQLLQRHMSVKNVHATLHAERADGVPLVAKGYSNSTGKGRDTLAGRVTMDERDNLERAASRRGITVAALTRKLIRVIAADPVLLTNVLDDGLK